MRRTSAEGDDDHTDARKERAMHDLLCSSFVAAVLSRILPESTLLENALRKKSLRFFNWMIDAANVRARRVTEKHRRKNNPLSRIDEAEGEQNRGSGLIRAPKSARPIISYRAAVRLSGSSDRRTLGGAGRFEIAMCDLKLGPRQGRDSAAQRAGAPQPGTVSRGFCVSALAGEMGLLKTAKRLDELESRLERKLANPRPGRCSDRPRLQRSPAFGYHRRKFIRQMLL